MQASRIISTTVILIILVCALGLRLYHLDYYDLWFGELSTETYTTQTLRVVAGHVGASEISVMFDQIKNDPHSCAYYLIVYLYSFLFRDDVPLRVFSVIFSMLSLWIFYRFSRLFFDRRTSFYAFLIMALNPFHLWYAQEARMYAMLCFFSLLAIYAYIKALKTDKHVYWVCFTLSSILTLFSSYHYVFLLMASGMALWLKQNRRHFVKWVSSVSFVLFVLVIFNQVLLSQLSFVKNSFWLSPPTTMALLRTWMFYSLGYSATETQYKIGLTIFFIFFVCGVFACFRENKENTGFLLLCLFFPIITIYLVSNLIMPIYIDRQLLIFSPFYYLFIAKGLVFIRYRLMRILATISLIGIMGVSLVNYYQGYNPSALLAGAFPKKNYAETMSWMRREFEPGDFIVAADLQSYVMARSEIIKHYKEYNRMPLDKFCFLAYPKHLGRYDKRFMRIEDLVGSILPKEGDLYGFVFMKNGKIGMVDDPVEKSPAGQRVWLLTSSFIDQEPWDPNIHLVKERMSKDFKKIAWEGKQGMYIGLYVK